MKIGIDARPLSKKRTGIGNYLYFILKEIRKIDDKNEYFLYSNRSFSLPFDEDHHWHKCISPARVGTIWYCFRLPQLIRNDSIDVFWGTQHVLPFGNRSIKYVLTIHDLAMYYFPAAATMYNYYVNRVLLPSSAKKADKIIAVSESTKKDIIEKLKIMENRISVIYEAADEKFRPGDQVRSKERVAVKYRIKHDYILYLGTLEPRKNINVLLEAYKLCVESRKIQHRLVIAGGRGWKSDGIFELTDRLGLADKVIFPGYIEDDDLPDLYNAASLFVFPSKYEGFGLPVLEAMSCSTPVITSNVSSLPEITGQAAVLTDPEDADMLADSILAVLKDEELRMDLKLKGIAQSCKFTWKACAEKVHWLLTNTGTPGGDCCCR